MNYQLTYKNDVAVVLIKEESLVKLDSNPLIEEVKDILQKKRIDLVIDLQRVNYLNSSGINLLISILTLIRNEEGELVLVSISEKIKNLLIITKLNSIFNVEEDVESGIRFLNVKEKMESN